MASHVGEVRWSEPVRSLITDMDEGVRPAKGFIEYTQDLIGHWRARGDRSMGFVSIGAAYSNTYCRLQLAPQYTRYRVETRRVGREDGR